jgi:hypothetical protein
MIQGSVLGLPNQLKKMLFFLNEMMLLKKTKMT